MSKFIREHLNNKITQVLVTFEKINTIIKDYDVKFFEYYEELRAGFITVLNDIVENYTYKENLRQLQRYKAEHEDLVKENDVLRKQLDAALNRAPDVKIQYTSDFEPRKEWNPRTKSPLNTIKETLGRVEETEMVKRKEFVSNGLLRWHNMKDLNAPINSLDYKALSHKELSDFIKELYEAKQLYDTGCRKQQQSVETMEQFMYNHLKYKFGNSKRVVEWIFGVIEAIKVYELSDNDVKVFKSVF